MPDTLCRRGNLDTDASTCVVHGGTFGRTCDAHSGVLRHIDALTAAVEALKFVPDEDVEGWEWISRSDVLAILRGEQ